MLRVSVVIPAYNAADTLGACLEALLEQSLPPRSYEIIVVDDGSTDDTGAVASRYGVRLVAQNNQGPAAARNAGISLARGAITLFTDADCIPTPTWMDEMTRPFGDPEVVGVRGTYLTLQTELVARFVQMEYEDRYDRMMGRERIDFIDTYSAGYRRDVLLVNKGFDVSFTTASVEDQELSYRLASRGYRMVFAPEAQVYHRHDRSCREYVLRKFYIGYWKSRLAGRYPGRMVRDAHTPQVLKGQIALLGLVALTAPACLLSKACVWVIGTLILLFTISAAPFLLKVVRKDRAVALVGLPLLVLRALALGGGFVIGWLRFRSHKKHAKSDYQSTLADSHSDG